MKVYCIGKPYFALSEFHAFLDDNNLTHEFDVEASWGERLSEVAGRVCYMSFGKGRKTNAEYLRNIIAQGHGSVLEHANYTFLITGVSRSLTHELVRHRHLSFSQLSQRYVDESEAEFIEPPVLPVLKPEDTQSWHDLMGVAKKLYGRLTEQLLEVAPGENLTDRRKWARQAARSVLPNATETKIVVTGNARAWRQFLEARGSIHAEVEIRRLAVMLHERLFDLAPEFFGDITYGEENGETHLKVEHHKV